jgi:hypothetical protein
MILQAQQNFSKANVRITYKYRVVLGSVIVPFVNTGNNNIKDLSPLQSIQICSWNFVHLVLVVKLPAVEAHNSPLSIAKVKNEWPYASTPS